MTDGDDDGLAQVVDAFAGAGQPDSTFEALDHVIGAKVGRAWTTILLVKGNELRRIFTSMPDDFPLGGVKPLDNAVWAQSMLTAHTLFLAEGVDAITASYRDHHLPLSRGVVRIANLPIVLNGQLLGALCINGQAEHVWDGTSLRLACGYAALIAPVVGCYHRVPEC